MTRPKVSRYTVTAFGPDLMAILVKGAREKIEIPCPDQRTMKYIQTRLQMLRGAMYREQHEQYELVTRTRTTRTWDPTDKNKNCVLKVYPNDSQFADIFKAAGIEATQHDRDLLDGIDGSTPPPSEPIVPSEPDPYQKWKKLI